jgi:hypothetical protein
MLLQIIRRYLAFFANQINSDYVGKSGDPISPGVSFAGDDEQPATVISDKSKTHMTRSIDYHLSVA